MKKRIHSIKHLNMVNQPLKHRIEFIDLAKGFCIILVVIFHITKFYNMSFPWGWDNFFRAFRMPLYFILSGFFFKTYGGLSSFIKKKINKLLIPFFFWYLSLSVLLSIVLYRYLDIVLEKAANFDFLSALTEFVIREDFPNSPIWFLLCLFEMNVLFYVIFLLSDYCNRYKSTVLIVTTLLIGYIGLLFSLLKYDLPMFIDSSMTSLPFFMMGYFIKRETPLLYPNKSDKYAILIIILGFIFVYIFASGGGFKLNHFGGKSLLTLYPCGLVGTMAVIYSAKMLNKMPFVSFWGRYSIMILVTHRFVYQFWDPIISRIIVNVDSWEKIVINLLLTMMSYQILIPLMKKYLPYVTGQKDLIK